ncbi:MAG: hypothetical protein EP332_10615 [Bacteroidetes bacterium]|nr:MAG: hypothetical protein EP332_10615 [Bacteroidota bacterium]
MKTLKTILSSAMMLALTGGAFAQTEPADTTNQPKVNAEVTKKGNAAEDDRIVFPVEGGRLIVIFEADSHKVAKTDSLKKPFKKREAEPRDFWAGMDFGFNGYLTPSGNTDMTAGNEHFNYRMGKSTYLGFNLFEKDIKLYKHHVVLLTGLGIDYNNYRFAQDVNPFEAADSNGMRTQKDYITNRLKTFHATVPLMLGLDFSKPGKNGLHMAAGVVGSVRFASYTKEKVRIEGGQYKQNTHNDFNLNPFRVNAQARVGYGDFTLFANYALTPMFKKDVGMPEVYPFSFGVSFGG